MAMFDPESVLAFKKLDKEEALEEIKSCFVELFIQLNEVGDRSASDSYASWLTESISNPNSDLRTAFSQSKSLLQTRREKLNSIMEDLNDSFRSQSREQENVVDQQPVLRFNEFLNSYDGVDVESVSPYRCADCGSDKTAPLSLISHSASVESMIQLFTLKLPDLSGMTVLDIGSGLGSLLYGAFYFSNAAQIIGVELNGKFCNAVTQMITKYSLGSRISIVNSNILEQNETMISADVVLFNNVLEFFAPVQVQKQIWKFLVDVIKFNAIIVTNPDLSTLLKPLQMDYLIDSWVDEHFENDRNIVNGFAETDESFYVYRVKKSNPVCS